MEEKKKGAREKLLTAMLEKSDKKKVLTAFTAVFVVQE